MASRAPEYDAYQSSFQEAFRTALYRIVDDLPMSEGALVLDVPSGHGFYTQRLAERSAHLSAVDACDEYLDRLRDRLADAKVDVRKANAYELPFENSTFDIVWCAQSLISLDPARAVCEMNRVVKADGLVAILEVDEFHHVLLPWPGALEAALPQAIHAASVRRYGDGVKLAPTRRLRKVLKEVGFSTVHRQTHAFERVSPFDPAAAAYLGQHFDYLREFAYPLLPAAMKSEFDRCTDPDAPDSLLHRPDVELVCINALYTARPSGAEERRRP